MSLPAGILVQAIGNPLRSDDGAGPLLIENAEQWQRYEMVNVVDAEASATQAGSWREIAVQQDFDSGRFDSHQQSPDAICQRSLSWVKP